jgi:hypothetical protein
MLKMIPDGHLRMEGHSLREIAAELNGRGITAARGGRWHAASIRALIFDQEKL